MDVSSMVLSLFYESICIFGLHSFLRQRVTGHELGRRRLLRIWFRSTLLQNSLLLLIGRGSCLLFHTSSPFRNLRTCFAIYQAEKQGTSFLTWPFDCLCHVPLNFFWYQCVLAWVEGRRTKPPEAFEMWVRCWVLWCFCRLLTQETLPLSSLWFSVLIVIANIYYLFEHCDGLQRFQYKLQDHSMSVPQPI